MIKKQSDGKFKVISHTGKNLGSDLTKEEAQKRLQQVEFFKNKKEETVLPKWDKLKKKIRSKGK